MEVPIAFLLFKYSSQGNFHWFFKNALVSPLKRLMKSFPISIFKISYTLSEVT